MRLIKKEEAQLGTLQAPLTHKLTSIRLLSDPLRQASLQLFMYHRLSHDTLLAAKSQLRSLLDELKNSKAARSGRLQRRFESLREMVEGDMKKSMEKSK